MQGTSGNRRGRYLNIHLLDLYSKFIVEKYLTDNRLFCLRRLNQSAFFEKNYIHIIFLYDPPSDGY